MSQPTRAARTSIALALRPHEGRCGSTSIGPPKVLSALSRLVIVTVVLAVAPPSLQATPLETNSSITLAWVPHFELPLNPRRAVHLGSAPIGPFTQDFSHRPFPGTLWQGHNSGQTIGQSRPGTPPGSFGAVRAMATAGAAGRLDELGRVVPAAGTSLVVAQMNFQFDVAEFVVSPLPPEFWALFGVPVEIGTRVTARAGATGQLSRADADALVQFGGVFGPVLNAAHANDVGQAVGEFSRNEIFTPFPIRPGQPVTLGLTAKVGLSTVADQSVFGPVLNTGTFGEAVADPVFSFDQEAFDELAQRQGFPTFTLADYWRFEFSPLGLPEPPPDGGPDPTPVPEPGMLALISLAVVWLAILRFLARSPACAAQVDGNQAERFFRHGRVAAWPESPRFPPRWGLGTVKIPHFERTPSPCG